MKYLICSMLLFTACIKDPVTTPAPAATTWIDVATHNDTIITNVSGNSSIIYYAIKNWQTLPDSSFTNGLRMIVASKADSVLVAPLNSTSSHYNGPFQILINSTRDTLRSQNFLDTIHKTVTRPFIKIN